MSKWISISAENIELSGNALEIYVTSDSDGAIYAEIPVPIIVDKIGEIL